jgi:hypothetical protein
MKKSILFFVGVLLLGCFVVWKKPFLSDPAPVAEAVNHEYRFSASDDVAVHSAVQEKKQEPPQEEAFKVEPHVEPSAVAVPPEYFPGAPVIATVTLEGKKTGETIVLKTVETDLKQPYVRIEETYRGTGKDRHLIDQAAMVANQVLVRKPAEATEEDFLEVVRGAGATDLKKMSSSYLVTFPARPEDPQALDAFMERLRLASQGKIVMEPNYVRKIF